MSHILPTDPQAPDPAAIAQAAALLLNGGLVAFPTETVYGLGADATDERAVRSVYRAKGRPSSNPLIVHAARTEEARAIADHWPDAAARLADRFWPGPLTIVLPRRIGTVHPAVSAHGPTVALRVPSHPVALALIQASGRPIAAPSANRSGHTSPTRAEHVVMSLGDAVPLILDAGPLPGGIESTVIDLSGARPRLLRPGLLSIERIEQLIGATERPEIRAASSDDGLRSPGLLTKHYAPNTPLILSSNIEAALEKYRNKERIGVITLQPVSPQVHATVIALPKNPDSYARELYHALHELDRAGLDRIIAELPPETDAWLGIRDRLQRAAA